MKSLHSLPCRNQKQLICVSVIFFKLRSKQSAVGALKSFKQHWYRGILGNQNQKNYFEWLCKVACTHKSIFLLGHHQTINGFLYVIKRNDKISAK